MIRAYQEGDESEILNLWKAAYPERRYDQKEWLSWWHWIYRENPAGWGRILLAEQDGQLVGHLGFIPMDLKIGADIVRIFQAIDLVTHPSYRRQGISSAMVRHSINENSKAGLHIIIGFPNDPSYRIHMRSGWFNIASMQRLDKVLDWQSLLQRKIGTGVLAPGWRLAFDKIFFRVTDPPRMEGLSVNEVETFDNRINGLWLKTRGQFMIMVARSEAYLNWRYGVPGQKYTKLVAEKEDEVLGYLILKHVTQGNVKVGYIFDLVSQSEEPMHHLVSKAIENCRLNGEEHITYPTIANKSYRRILGRNGFISLPFLRRPRFCAYSTPPEASKRILECPRNWLVQLGDSDFLD